MFVRSRKRSSLTSCSLTGQWKETIGLPQRGSGLEDEADEEVKCVSEAIAVRSTAGASISTGKENLGPTSACHTTPITRFSGNSRKPPSGVKTRPLNHDNYPTPSDVVRSQLVEVQSVSKVQSEPNRTTDTGIASSSTACQPSSVSSFPSTQASRLVEQQLTTSTWAQGQCTSQEQSTCVGRDSEGLRHSRELDEFALAFQGLETVVMRSANRERKLKKLKLLGVGGSSKVRGGGCVCRG